MSGIGRIYKRNEVWWIDYSFRGKRPSGILGLDAKGRRHETASEANGGNGQRTHHRA